MFLEIASLAAGTHQRMIDLMKTISLIIIRDFQPSLSFLMYSDFLSI